MFNNLTKDYGELSIDFLVRLLYNDYCYIIRKKKNKSLKNIDKKFG